MNWKELFDEDRLTRGFEYYLENKVYDVILTQNSITSKVEGSRSKIYDVNINFDDNGIDSLYCTCPYSYADFNCKHMVATLYKMEEIQNNTFSSIVAKTEDNNLFTELIATVDQKQLRRYIYEKFKDDTSFKDDFINKFQQEITPEDLYNYENMLENIFNIDVVELYNENGFYQEAPFQKYLENFINEKISLLYKNGEYSYVTQLLYIIYDNISQKDDVTQYIEIDEILKQCNYYMEKIIDAGTPVEKEEIFNYLINKIRIDYNIKTSKYLIDVCLNKYQSKVFLKQLDEILDELINNQQNISDDVLLSKYELMNKLGYTTTEKRRFLEENKSIEKVMRILVNEEINKGNYENAIEYLNYNMDMHGKTYSLEETLLLLSLYNTLKDMENVVRVLKIIIYDFNVEDMDFIIQLKNSMDENQWNDEKIKLIEFYKENYSYNFLNSLYVEEKDYDNLFLNITSNCQITVIEDFKQYLLDKYNDEILKIYRQVVLNEAKSSKNISGYTLIINYLDLMINYKNSSMIVKDLISVLKNKYNQRKLFMEKLEEFEIINSLN